MDVPQVDPLDITNESNWNSGDYELEILLGERDDTRMVAAYYACWSAPELQGPYLRADIPIAEQTIAAPAFDGILHRLTYGVAHIPECTPLLCGSYAIRWENDVTDTFGLYIPIGTHDHAAAQIGVSFFSSHRDPTIVRWWEAIDAWMVTLGRHIYERVPFRHARIGMEGMEHRVEMETTDPPLEERLNGYLLPRDGELRYIPATA